jgi:hypothetical protein
MQMDPLYPYTQITSEEKLFDIRKILEIFSKLIPRSIRHQWNRIFEELSWKNSCEFLLQYVGLSPSIFLRIYQKICYEFLSWLLVLYWVLCPASVKTRSHW